MLTLSEMMAGPDVHQEHIERQTPYQTLKMHANPAKTLLQKHCMLRRKRQILATDHSLKKADS